MDVDGSGEITAVEMESFLSDPRLKVYLCALGITAESTRMLFDLVDVDQSGKIDMDEFCEGCLRLQGEAKSTDVHMLIYQVRLFLFKWSEFTEFVEAKLNSISVNESAVARRCALQYSRTATNTSVTAA